MTKKKLTSKMILDVGNSAARCAVCEDGIQRGMGIMDFKKLKNLAKKVGVKAFELGKNNQDILKAGLKAVQKGERSPQELLKTMTPIIANKWAKKMAGQGYSCGTGFESKCSKEMEQTGGNVFDDLLGIAALMDPTGLVRTGVIAKNALGMGVVQAGGGVVQAGGGVVQAGGKYGSGVVQAGGNHGSGVVQAGGFLGMDWLPSPSEVLGGIPVIGESAAMLTGTIGLGAKTAGGGRKPSAWIAHVKAYRAKNGGSYKDAMKNAKASYRK